MYIIINESTNMSKGKLISQISHGILEVYRFLIEHKIDFSKWTDSGEKIVVLKTNQKNIEKILNEFQDKIYKQNTLNIFPVYGEGKTTHVKEGSLAILTTTPISDDKKPVIFNKFKLL